MNRTLLQSQPVKKVLKFLRKISIKRVILVAAALVVIFLIYIVATKEPSGITSIEATRGTLVAGFSANGKIKAKKIADLKFNAPAKVAWISVKDGDKVVFGQRLAGLDAVALNAAYQTALNNYRDAQATADMVLDSVQGHARDENFTQRAARTSAEVARDNSYNAILASRNALGNSMLVSPFAGEVIDTNEITAGVNLSGADLESKFIRVIDPASFYFDAQLDEIDFSKVSLGQEVVVSVDAFPGNECNGKVTKIGKNGAETTGGVVTIPVEVTLSDCNLNLAVNLNGEARFVQEKVENALIIPRKYIVIKNDQNYVWKQIGTSTKNRKLFPIKLGASSSTEVEVIEGVSEGDKIIYIP